MLPYRKALFDKRNKNFDIIDSEEIKTKKETKTVVQN
jgi:hypothetical protein